MTNDETIRKSAFEIRHSFIPSAFDIRHSTFRERGSAAFTIIELLVVITLIIVLAGLIFSTVGHVQNKGARSRAETEIAAISAALENYKADNGIYPRDATATDGLDPNTPINFSNYQTASQYLYGQLAGDADFKGIANPNSKLYMQFKPNQLGKDTSGKPYLRDPFGNSYGYSTMKAANPSGTAGYDPTFDLWSTANSSNQTQWIKNW